MRTMAPKFHLRSLTGFLTVGLLVGCALPSLKAQEIIPAPIQPAFQKVGLQECLALGFGNQPALAAARASLAAAESGQRGLDRILLGRLITPDLGVRRKQACLGVQIAQASLFQAEWETRYAITRNYYSVIYARSQAEVVRGLVEKLDRAAKTAEDLLKAGDPKLKVNAIDLQNLILNREFYKAREMEAIFGIQKAMAALREAIGISHDYPLDTRADQLPALVENLNREELIALGLAQRGEMAQVIAANRVTELEIEAQGKIRSPSARTFAMGSDIHAKPIPQGVANGEYRPGAIGLEMPVTMAGPRHERVQRARDLNDRAIAVVDKTENLIALEVEAAYLKWREAAERVKILEKTPILAQKIAINTQDRFDIGSVSGEELIRARTTEDQARANYNEALYSHALGLAALERVTAGGYQVPHQP